MSDCNGADAIVGTLADHGVTVCFANPGTSEMHLVAALDREPRIRSVLCLFEGVATGAADGFARIAGVPAMTLLHLGPGYANGAANLHNARRAFSPIVNIVGDHAISHAGCDSPLSSDIATLASTSSVWVRSVDDAGSLADATAAAYAASTAPVGGPVTLIVPADCAWSSTAARAIRGGVVAPSVDAALLGTAVDALRSARSPAILLGTHATRCEHSLTAASRLAASGVAVFADTFVARQLRGGDRFEPMRLPYWSEDAAALLSGYDLLVLAGTTKPVAFFAYPNRPDTLVPPGTDTVTLCNRRDDVAASLVSLAKAIQACTKAVAVGRPNSTAAPTGELTAATVGQSLARHMPAGTIVSDDGVTSSGPVFVATARAATHDWLSLTGGAIGQGLPVAIGAAVARPDAKVVALTGDGAAMYTPQALWTMARERLDVTIVVFANQAYRILDIEFGRTGSGQPGEKAARLLDIADPAIDWCAVAASMGVSAAPCTDAAGFDAALEKAMMARGPMLIEARIA